jgi:sirohydrochlorin cobaltochelatase
MANAINDPRAPMSSAPMKYDADGQVDWGNMWDSFCVLALEGGPPHRATQLAPAAQPDSADPRYAWAATEIGRGIAGVSGLPTHPAAPGWIAMACGSAAMARWLADAIEAENVSARADGAAVLLPVDGSFRLEGEIKNVVTAVAKTTHYWAAHVPVETKQTLAAEAWLGAWTQGLRRRLSAWRLGTHGDGHA